MKQQTFWCINSSRLYFQAVKEEIDKKKCQSNVKFHECDEHFEIHLFSNSNEMKWKEKQRKHKLIFDLFICAPIIRNKYILGYLFYRKSEINLFSFLCLFTFLNRSWSFPSYIYLILHGCSAIEKFAFQWIFNANVIICDFLDSKDRQIKGVFQCGRLFLSVKRNRNSILIM